MKHSYLFAAMACIGSIAPLVTAMPTLERRSSSQSTTAPSFQGSSSQISSKAEGHASTEPLSSTPAANSGARPEQFPRNTATGSNDAINFSVSRKNPYGGTSHTSVQGVQITKGGRPVNSMSVVHSPGGALVVNTQEGQDSELDPFATQSNSGPTPYTYNDGSLQAHSNVRLDVSSGQSTGRATGSNTQGNRDSTLHKA